MGKKYLLDTNAIIDFCACLLPETSNILISNIIDTDPIISVVNKMKLLSRNKVPTAIDAFLTIATVIPLDDIITEQTIALRKKHKIKLPDAVIAATAINNKLILVTENIKDFTNIKGLQLINPFEM